MSLVDLKLTIVDEGSHQNQDIKPHCLVAGAYFKIDLMHG